MKRSWLPPFARQVHSGRRSRPWRVPPGLWSMPEEDLSLLRESLRNFEQYRDVAVLELGSGHSTEQIALQLDSMNLEEWSLDCIETSLDYCTDFHVETFKSISSKIHLHHVPLRWSQNRDGVGFDRAAFSRATRLNAPYDFVLVDSPPDIVGENARLRAIEAAILLMHTKSVMFVHDVNRNEERYAVEVIRSKFLCVDVVRSRAGVAICRYPVGPTTKRMRIG